MTFNIKGYIYNIAKLVFIYIINFSLISSILIVVTIKCCDYMKYIVNECHTDMFFQCMSYKLIISQNNIIKTSSNK